MVPGEYYESQGCPEDDEGSGSRLPEDLLKESCLPVHWFVNVSKAFDKEKSFKTDVSEEGDPYGKQICIMDTGGNHRE